jgi:hypothetical protein
MPGVQVCAPSFATFRPNLVARSEKPDAKAIPNWNRPATTFSVDISRRMRSHRSARGLFSREFRYSANGTQVETRQPPLPLLLNKHQCSAKLRLDAVAAIDSILDLTASQDGCFVVQAHLDLI